MNCVDIQEAILENAIFDNFTIWPEGFDPISRGAVEI
jgi:hypothetical protein